MLSYRSIIWVKAPNASWNIFKHLDNNFLESSFGRRYQDTFGVLYGTFTEEPVCQIMADRRLYFRHALIAHIVNACLPPMHNKGIFDYLTCNMQTLSADIAFWAADELCTPELTTFLPAAVAFVIAVPIAATLNFARLAVAAVATLAVSLIVGFVAAVAALFEVCRDPADRVFNLKENSTNFRFFTRPAPSGVTPLTLLPDREARFDYN